MKFMKSVHAAAALSGVIAPKDLNVDSQSMFHSLCRLSGLVN